MTPPLRHTRRALVPIMLAALLLAAAPPGAAVAQPAQPPAPTARAETPVSAAEVERIRLAAASRLARLALLYVREVSEPLPADYHAAALMLNEAHLLAPGDEEILRRLLEAWHAAGDEARVLEMTRRLVALNPEDTVAQLRLITSRIRLLQDADARLGAYERLLGSDGASIHPSIRSRLALDAALLHREAGDDARFAARLALAAQLDSTNKDAAVIAATFSLPRTADPLGRVELLANVVLADPLDPSAHLNLARELMSRGAYRGARRFYERTLDVQRAMGLPPDEDVYDEMFRVRWAIEGVGAILDIYQRDELAYHEYLRKTRESLVKAGRDPAEAPDYTPNPRTEKLRLLGASALGRTDDANAAMARIASHASEVLKQLAERARTHPEEGRQLIQIGREVQTETTWLALWSGVLVGGARTALPVLQEELGPVARDRYTGWLALRDGDFQRARELLEPLAKTDLRSRLGLGVLAELTGDTRAAVSEYARVALAQPGESIGLWARTRIETLLEERLRPTPTATALEDYVARLPSQIDAMTGNGRSFMQLIAEQVDPQPGAIDRANILIRLRNTGVIPLAVGAGAPLNSSMLLAPRLLIEGHQLIDEVRPEVASLDRKLMLRPGEFVEAVVWADQGVTGHILDQTAGRFVTLRWSVVQGFRLPPPTPAGAAPPPERYTTGPLCLITETGIQTRHHVRAPGAGEDADLVAAIRDRRGERLLSMVLYARHRHTRAQLDLERAIYDEVQADLAEHGTRSRFSSGRMTEGERRAELASELRKRLAPSNQPIAQALAQRYESMSPEERLFAAAVVPNSSIAPGFEAFDDATRSDATRAVRLANLVGRVAGPDDPFLSDCVAGEDEVVATVASILKARLTRAPTGTTPATAP